MFQRKMFLNTFYFITLAKNHYQVQPLSGFQNLQFTYQKDAHSKWGQVVWFLKICMDSDKYLFIFNYLYFFKYLHLWLGPLEKMSSNSVLRCPSASSISSKCSCSSELPSAILIGPFAPRGGWLAVAES